MSKPANDLTPEEVITGFFEGKSTVEELRDRLTSFDALDALKLEEYTPSQQHFSVGLGMLMHKWGSDLPYQFAESISIRGASFGYIFEDVLWHKWMEA